MDTLSHGLWAAVAAKAANKILKGRGSEKKFNPWHAGFWGIFPDLLAFTPLFFWVAARMLTGVFSFSDFGSPNPQQYQLTPISSITGTLYDLTHSAITFAIVFGIAWLVLHRPVWELGGWLLHILMDIPTHPASFYPTSILWPLSPFHVSGISWATPMFLLVNYAALAVLFYLLREKTPAVPSPLTKRQRLLRLARNILFAAFTVIIALSIYAALRIRHDQPPPPPPPQSEVEDTLHP